MRILYIHSSSLIGGGNRVLLNLFEGLDRSRFQPVSVIPEPGPLEAELRRVDVPYFCLDIRPKAIGRVKFARKILYLAALCFRYRVGILHANDPITYRCASIAAKLCGSARICHVHHPGETAESLAWAFRLPPKLIVTPSLFMKREVSDRLGAQFPSRIEAVWNQVDTDWFAPVLDRPALRAAIGLEPGSKHICIMATLAPHKGHICFLRAARSILRCFPNATFHVLGGTSAGCERHAEALIRLAREIGIADRVRFWGFVPNALARDILRASDLLILPTQEEGFGLSVAEAQSCQVPVLTSSISPLDEVVDDRRTGHLIPAGDHEQFAAHAIHLLECEEKRKIMGLAGREWVMHRFSRAAHVSRIMCLYQSVRSYQNCRTQGDSVLNESRYNNREHREETE